MIWINQIKYFKFVTLMHSMKGWIKLMTKMKNTQNNKKEDGKFKSKNIKHDPQAESARRVFEEPKTHSYD